ncbi:cell division cycle 27-like protein [Vairimorpha necatrix]|uniref:Cell division cycle 27-like protein n=1 Tax=Vairimorpha necatrix TaxID=6039 RepID=A0AAX4J8S2_9MICR
MFEDVVDQIIKSYKYANYTNMTFLSSFLYSYTSKYKILLPISLYFTGEYSRSLSLLSPYNTCTALYYKYLCYNQLRDFTNALICLQKIIAEEVEVDDFDLEIFKVNKNDKEYFYNDMALCYTQLYDRDEAIRLFKMSYQIYPIFSTIENLIYENELEEIGQNKFKENNFNNQIKTVSSLDEFIRNVKNNDALEKYTNFIPGLGSYALAFQAKNEFDLGLTESSKKIFTVLKSKDPKFIYNMDYFSTVLWHSTDVTDLGILCKNLINDAPLSPVTWKALGNYYNHKNDYKRSILCLKRSLHLLNDPYTLNLLGFESVYKNEYMEALEYFKKSTLMLRNNYKSLYGCALVYDKIDKKSTADFYFKKCMFNNQLRAMGMKFYIKHGELDKAIQIYKIGMKFDNVDLNNLVKETLNKKGKFDNIEEFMILEFVEILTKLNLLDFAKTILNIVEYRGETYYKKKEIVFEKKHSFI